MSLSPFTTSARLATFTYEPSTMWDLHYLMMLHGQLHATLYSHVLTTVAHFLLACRKPTFPNYSECRTLLPGQSLDVENLTTLHQLWTSLAADSTTCYFQSRHHYLQIETVLPTNLPFRPASRLHTEGPTALCISTTSTHRSWPNPLELQCSHNVVLLQLLQTSGTVYQNTSDSVVT